MRKDWILDKNHLSYWLRQLRKERELIGPLRGRDRDILFRTVEQIHEILLDAPASVPSQKELLFPQYEGMLKLDFTSPSAPVGTAEERGVPRGARIRGDEAVTDFADERKRVIFGVRSCDISAVRLLDRFFLGGLKDPYYEARRRRTLFISLVCNSPDPTCFCIGLGTGPYLEEGFDIQLTDLGDRYFIQAGSDEGKRAVRGFTFLFRRPQKNDYDDQYEVFLSSKARFHKRITLENPSRMILAGRWKDDFWEEISGRCFECGGCVYSCPLCTCFTVTDRTYTDGIERIRLWDTCLFKGFTRMAGGIVPNERKMLRVKRWYYHKLVHYPEVFDEFGCVGCGRCSTACPAKIDMATVATGIKGLALHEE